MCSIFHCIQMRMAPGTMHFNPPFLHIFSSLTYSRPGMQFMKWETLHGWLINDVCHITIPSRCLYGGLTDRCQGEINEPYSWKPAHGSFTTVLMIKTRKSKGRALFVLTANEWFVGKWSKWKWISLVVYWEFTATTIHIYTNACICAGLCKHLWHLIISSNQNTDQLIVWTKAWTDTIWDSQELLKWLLLLCRINYGMLLCRVLWLIC